MTAARSAGATARRDPAVDAVRGLALLGSTVAVALTWLGGRQVGAGYRPLDGDARDRAVDLLTGALVDNRVMAVFALLLGYGVASRTGRADRAAAGPGGPHAPPDAAEWAHGLRRAGALVGLGALHAALVLDADVLGALGVLLLLAVPLARARTRTHVLVCVLVVPALLVHGALDGFGGSFAFPDPPSDYLLSVVDRLGTWLLALVLFVPASSGLLVAVVLGVRLSRSGWGAEPLAHRGRLLGVGVGAGAVGLLGALPYARVLGAGRLPDVAVALRVGVLDAVTGPVAALGAVCLLLAAVPALPRAGLAGPALALLGRRSLAVYLAHSVVLALVLAPWAGGVGARWGSAPATVLALGLWGVTLVGALVVVARGVGRRPAQPTERQGRDLSSAA